MMGISPGVRDALVFIGLLLVVASSVFAAAWIVQDWRYQARIAAIHANHAQSLAQAQASAREIEQRHIREIDDVRTTAQVQIDALQADVARADDVASRLRRELAALRARRTARDSAATERGTSEPRTDPADLLAGLLERVERDGRAIARYADQSRVAALACEAGFDSLRHDATGKRP